jgi:DNA polymerase elongation subunit (family B)
MELPEIIRKNSFACFGSLNASERSVILMGDDEYRKSLDLENDDAPCWKIPSKESTTFVGWNPQCIPTIVVDPMFQVRLWDTIIYNYLKKRNIVVPQMDRTDKDSKFAGAYVKEPVPGVYDWVVSFDLNSLYPHLIMQYNISPETLLDEKHPTATVDRILDETVNFEMYKDNAVCANGAMYRKDVKGFLPELMEKMYAERKAFKGKMLKSKQKLVDIEAEMKKRGL